MLTPGRSLQAVVVLGIIALFYFTGPFTSSEPVAQKRPSNAEARLARWVEVVTPSEQEHVVENDFNLPGYVSDFFNAKAMVPINPFPLGRPTTTTAFAPEVTGHGLEFNEVKFSFQEDVQLPFPRLNFRKFKDYAPRNYKAGEKQETFATYLCTRNGSVYDPYFAATLNLVYRNLWSPEIASKSRPFTVFVAPFIPQQQREMLEGAGAIVRELGLLPWEPNVEGVFSRWQDQFSKIHMWGQTRYKTIAFMDSDAFPIRNIDAVFDQVKPQTCDPTKMDAEEIKSKDELCAYKFAGVRNIGVDESINGGFLVFDPHPAMQQRLLQNYVKVDKYDNHEAEQSFLSWQFAKNGPFPVQILPRKYNAFFPTKADEGKVSIVHEKLWAWDEELPDWLKGLWSKGWTEMIEFFESPEFREAREKDKDTTFERDDRSVDQHAAAHGASTHAHSKKTSDDHTPDIPEKQQRLPDRRNRRGKA